MIQNVTYKEAVAQYVDDILSGEIPACRATVQAVERYRRDREREGIDPDFPYTFNAARAEIVCRFFPSVLKHFKGRQWKGNAFQLYPAQLFWAWNIFGWQRTDGSRRFRRVFISVGRKGGKSSFCAGLALFLCIMDGEPGAEVYIGATKIDQAKIIFKSAKAMADISPHIPATVQKDNIYFADSMSVILPLGSDKGFDGLDPHGVFFDEMHKWKEYHRDFYDTMTTGGGARVQPLQVTITTAGDDKAVIYNEESNYARDVLSGSLVDDSLFAMIYELEKDDDIYDEDLWIKANPGLPYGAPRLDYLQDEATVAKQKRSAERKFKRYNMNICLATTEKATEREDYEARTGPLSDWDDAEAVAIGVDCGGFSDLASVGYAARFPCWSLVEWDEDGRTKPRDPVYRYEVTSKNFMSSRTKRDLDEHPFFDWIEDGDLEKVDFVYNSVKDTAIEESYRLGVTLGANDPRNASQMSEDFELAGLDVLPMTQSPTHFNDVILEYEAAMREGRITFDETDPVMKWCFLNMVFKNNSTNDRMPDKLTSKDKIDAAVAVLMAIRAVRVAPGRIDGPLYMS